MLILLILLLIIGLNYVSFELRMILIFDASVFVVNILLIRLLFMVYGFLVCPIVLSSNNKCCILVSEFTRVFMMQLVTQGETTHTS